MIRAVILHQKDNVATLIDEGIGGAGARLTGVGDDTVTLRGDIAYGHKCAITPIDRGGEVFKYGQVIGRATEDIMIGDHVHVHNVEALRARGDK